jgi:hypothetical protein
MDRSNPSFGSQVSRMVACLGAVLLLVPLLGAFASPAHAQGDDSDNVVIFVLDLSGSMNEPFDDERTKLDVAKAAFTEAFANVSPEARVGLRTYGDQIPAAAPGSREASCTTDSRIANGVAPLQREELIAQVQGFTALGDTPIALALQQASTDMPAGSTGTIVLFSDGRDECYDADLDGDPASGPSYGQDPCEVAKAITNGDAAVDRVATVGFRADNAAEAELRCIADSTGGSYTAIESPQDARDALPQLLVQLSAPREAQRLIGRQIQGATSTDDAPDFTHLDQVNATGLLYTDSIDMNSVRIYRMPEYGPDGGTFTATVFGLPPEPGIAFDMHIFVPKLDQRFFQGQHGDFNVGLPQRPTASIRCTDCQITGGPHEAFFVVTLDSDGTGPEGSYELEILTEGPGFGGITTSCSAPQECFYPQEIIDLTEQLESSRSELNIGVGELASPGLIAERDQLRVDTSDEQNAVDAANARAQELEERIPLAPTKSNSFGLPLLMILGGAGLAFAPMHRLRRAAKHDTKKKEDEDAELEPAPVSAPAQAQVTAERTRPTLDNVGPTPAVRPNLKNQGNDWDVELEAAKAALAQQRPERAPNPEVAEPLAASEPSAAPAAAPDESVKGQFTTDQHAAAKAAAGKIAAQQTTEQAAGWHEDPAIIGQFRWWDGSTWTGHTATTDQEPTPS